MRTRFLVILGTCLMMLQQPLRAADEPTGWGSLRGRIIYDGDLPIAEQLQITRDEEFCGQFSLVDESLLVHPKSKGLRHIAVWLDSRSPIPIHPDAVDLPEKPAVVDNLQCRFSPRLQVVRTGQTVEFRNSDPVSHNVAVFAQRNQPFSEIVSATQPLQKSFAKAESAPIRIDCSIHSWMRSYLLISDHPCVAVTDADGSFQIRNIPAGEWKFRFWHERPGYIKELQQSANSLSLEKGVWTIRIAAGTETDLGELTAPAALFAAKK